MKTEVKKKTVRKTGLMIPVYDPTGKVEKELELPKTIFSVKTSPKLLAHYVRVFLVNQRQGTASTKTRGEVIGSTRKIYRQKGTGRARHGDIKAPIFVGGGIVGGPKPKNYSLKINNKQKKKAFLGALSLRCETKGLIGLSDKFLTIEPKTKKMADFFKKINLEKDKKLLIIPRQEKNNLILATRNIPKVTVVEAESVNSYQVLNHQKVLILVKAIDVIKKMHERNEN